MPTNRHKDSVKNVEGDFAAFSDLLRRVVSVPRARITARLEAEKSQKRQRANTSASARASRDKG